MPVCSTQLRTAALCATSSFSTVTAERSVNIQVVGDKDAFLAMQPLDGENADYATTTSNGQLEINLNGDAGGDVSGQGVNPDAVTSFDNVFTITNKGSQPVTVWVEDGSDKVSFYMGDTGTRMDSDGEAQSIGVGETKKIGIVVDARETGQGETFGLGTGDDDMIIHASADGATAPEEASSSSGGGGGSDGSGGS